MYKQIPRIVRYVAKTLHEGAAIPLNLGIHSGVLFIQCHLELGCYSEVNKTEDRHEYPRDYK